MELDASARSAAVRDWHGIFLIARHNFAADAIGCSRSFCTIRGPIGLAGLLFLTRSALARLICRDRSSRQARWWCFHSRLY